MSKTTRVVVEQHIDQFLVYDPNYFIIGDGKTLEEAIECFKKFYDLLQHESKQLPNDTLLDVYITQIELTEEDNAQKEETAQAI